MTKYAPDQASNVKVRLINDAASGTAYFDTMKFRRVNWIDTVSEATISFMQIYPDKFFTIWYSNTGTVNPLIENL